MFGDDRDGSRDVALGEIHKLAVMFTKDDEWPAQRISFSIRRMVQ